MSFEDPERALALTYAPAGSRPGVAALFALDDALGRVLRTTTEPALGQMRLVWWRDRLAKLGYEPTPAEPVLQGVAELMRTGGVAGETLALIAEGWHVLIVADRLDAEALSAYAEGRAMLFEAAGELVGALPADPIADAGAGWALADLAVHISDAEEAAIARELARRHLDIACRARWSVNARMLGALAHLARIDLQHADALPRRGAPRRVVRMAWHRITGR